MEAPFEMDDVREDDTKEIMVIKADGDRKTWRRKERKV
jgi:hypothetical protein